MKLIVVTIISLLFFVYLPLINGGLSAQFGGIDNPPGFSLGGTTIGGLITVLLTPVFTLAGMVALLFLIWGGVRYMTARGDPKAADAARSTLTSAVIGLFIILFIAALFTIVGGIFNIGVFSSLPLVPAAYAQGVDIGSTVQLGGETINFFGSFGQLFTRVVFTALAIAGVVFLAMMVWGGLRYLNAGGDPKNADSARSTLTNALVGIIIVVVSLVIIEIATSVAGVGSIF